MVFLVSHNDICSMLIPHARTHKHFRLLLDCCYSTPLFTAGPSLSLFENLLQNEYVQYANEMHFMDITIIIWCNAFCFISISSVRWKATPSFFFVDSIRIKLYILCNGFFRFDTFFFVWYGVVAQNVLCFIIIKIFFFGR